MPSPPLGPLTFKDITEVYRTERKTKNLTEIRRDFYDAAGAFLEKLRKDTEEKREDPFSLQVLGLSDTIKKVSSKTIQIFEIRAEKILLMALRASSGAEVDVSRLTREESQLYKDTLASLRERRSDLFSLGRRIQPAPDIKAGIEEETEISDVEEEGAGTLEEELPEQREMELISEQEPSSMEKIVQEENLIIRVLEDVPPFAGPERDYRLSKEDVVILPAIIARALVSKGKAEEIKVKK
jgi:DNA replication factor GINS